MKLVVDGKEIVVHGDLSIQFEDGGVSGNLEITANENEIVFKVIDAGETVATQELQIEQIIEMTVADNGFGSNPNDDDDY